MDGRSDILMKRWSDGWTYGGGDGVMDGLMDRWSDGWMSDGWME